MPKTKKAQLVKGNVVPFGFDEEIEADEDGFPMTDEDAHYNELAYSADLEHLAKVCGRRAV